MGVIVIRFRDANQTFFSMQIRCESHAHFRTRFVCQLVEQMGERLEAEHYGEERRETDGQKAERIVVAELKRRGWKDSS
jgi:hypothetical protein